MELNSLYEHALMGGTFINAGSGAVTGKFKAFQVIETTSLTNIDFEQPNVQSPVVSGANVTYGGKTILEAASLSPGLYIPVPFTSITVASGTVFAIGQVD